MTSSRLKAPFSDGGAIAYIFLDYLFQVLVSRFLSQKFENGVKISPSFSDSAWPPPQMPAAQSKGRDAFAPRPLIFPS
ncbi:MAG: hypothetical protein QM636_06145 [Rhizobium sp.]